MSPEKNGVMVEEHRGQNEPYKIWNADLWKCPKCGFELIAGFGSRPIVEHFHEAYKDFQKKVTHHIKEF